MGKTCNLQTALQSLFGKHSVSTRRADKRVDHFKSGKTRRFIKPSFSCQDMIFSIYAFCLYDMINCHKLLYYEHWTDKGKSFWCI